MLNNRDLNQVTWEQRAMEGDPQPVDAGAPGRALRGLREADRPRRRPGRAPDRIEAAWDEAFSADRPFVIDAVTDPEVPPLPPHITVEQAKAFMHAVKGGDPSARAMMTQSFKQKILEFLPGR